MNPVLNTTIPTTSSKSDIYFLVALLVMVVAQFLLFYFGIPRFASGFSQSELVSPQQYGNG